MINAVDMNNALTSSGDIVGALDKVRIKAPHQNKGSSSGARHGVHCVVCNKLFNNSSALAKHKLTHSDERKYICKICSKAFKRQDHL